MDYSDNQTNYDACTNLEFKISELLDNITVVQPDEYAGYAVIRTEVLVELTRLAYLTKSARCSLLETDTVYKQHTTSEGETMYIAAMRDSHLWNTIKLLCTQIDEQILIITGEYTSDTDPFMSALLPQSNVQAQRDIARNRLAHLVNMLPNYVMEATLRDFEDLPQLLQETFNRSKKISARTTNQKPLLLDGSVE